VGLTGQRLSAGAVGGGHPVGVQAALGPKGEVGRFGWLSAHAGFKGFPIYLTPNFYLIQI
jgi:hypothetical protein